MSLLLLLVGATTAAPPAVVAQDDQIRLGVKPTFGVNPQPNIGTMQTT